MMNNVIEVKELTKSFKLFHSNKDRLLNIIPFINKKFDFHTSLKNISFEVKKGEFVSIIGKNGSGKSTLLKILCGVLQKTNGEYIVNGSIVSLLELGTGFNPELSGRENIISSSKTMNFDINYINLKLKEIEAFADLEEYFDMPIKTYSSGMYVRLAMSLFLHLNPSIFIIDEALSVGDIFFQQKCFSKIEEMRKNGVAFLFVSHDINTVLNMSDRVLLLEYGNQIYFGDKNEACKLYYDSEIKIESSFNKINNALEKTEYFIKNNILEGKDQIFHRKGALLESLQIVDEFDNNTRQVEMTKKLKFIIGYKVEKILDNPAIAISFYNNKNMLLSTIVYDLRHNKNFIEITIPFMFEAGEYSFNMNIGNLTGPNSGVYITEIKSVSTIVVFFDFLNRAPFLGIVGLDSKMKFLQ
jgi:ABC-type polysaccharide/polyol phosphate transport system ATPase subunit